MKGYWYLEAMKAQGTDQSRTCKIFLSEGVFHTWHTSYLKVLPNIQANGENKTKPNLSLRT